MQVLQVLYNLRTVTLATGASFQVLLDDLKVARGVRTRPCSVKLCSEETREFTANKEVILSAGSARDPQILMLSGIGPRDELEKHSVGL